jgi:hypothetical protein
MVVEILKSSIDGDVWRETILWEPLLISSQAANFRR